jgi:hypothetical protein
MLTAVGWIPLRRADGVGKKRTKQERDTEERVTGNLFFGIIDDRD